MPDVTFIVDDRWGAHVPELLDERAQDRLAILPARLAVAVVQMGDDELDALIAGYQAPNDRVRSYKHLREVLAKDSFGIRAAGRTEAGVPLIEVRAADIRGVLYGAFELIEKLRRGEDVASIDLIEVPDLPIRINYEFLTVAQRLSRSANRRRIVDFFRKEAFYLRFNGIYPAVSNGRAILPIGYPHYADRRCLKSEYFQELQLIYDQCVRWGLDFYCPVNLIGLPVQFEPLIGSQMSTHLSCLKFSDRAEGVRWLKEHFAELFTPDGKLDIGNRAFENMLRAELTFALECFPQMKGVNVYPCEDGQYNVVMGRSYGGLDLAIDPQRDYGRFFRCIADAIGADRQMFVFTHMPVGVGDPIGKILRDQFPEVVQFAEVQTGPQYPGKAIFGHLGNDEAARRDRVSAQATAGWILFDAEHIGWRSVEFCLAAQARSTVSTIAGYGALGIGGRTSRDYGAGMGTLLEGASYAGSRTAWSLDAELDTLMGEWIASYFGPGAPVDELRRILLAHDELFRKGVLVQSVSLYDLVGGNEHEDQVLATAYHGSLRYPQILELFAPEGTKMKDVLSRYRDRVITEQLGTVAVGAQQVLDEKDQAVALATELVAKVKALRGRATAGGGELVEPDRYARLLEIHENLLRLMRANRDFVTALQLEVRLRADPKLFEQLHPTYVEALDLLEETAYCIRTAKGDGFFYGYTRGLMNYVQIARLRLGAMKAARLGA